MSSELSRCLRVNNIICEHDFDKPGVRFIHQGTDSESMNLGKCIGRQNDMLSLSKNLGDEKTYAQDTRLTIVEAKAWTRID